MSCWNNESLRAGRDGRGQNGTHLVTQVLGQLMKAMDFSLGSCVIVCGTLLATTTCSQSGAVRETDVEQVASACAGAAETPDVYASCHAQFVSVHDEAPVLTCRMSLDCPFGVA